MLLCLHLLPKRHSNLTYHSRVTATPGNTSALLAVIAVTVLLLLLQGWSQCCERRGPLMSSSWLLSRWAVLHCTAAMLCSIFTHQCSCMSISCATLMHATTVLLISMTKGQHHHGMNSVHIVHHHAWLWQRHTMLTNQVADHAERDSQSPQTPTLMRPGDSREGIGTCKWQTRCPMLEVLTLHVLGQTNLTVTIQTAKYILLHE